VPATARRGWTEREQADVERSCLRVSAELEGRRSGPRLLVLGTEELMFVPMLLAAHQSGDVRVRSTTRSPILVSSQPGYPIREGVAYEATDGTSGRRYLYNLTSDAVDDVFLCCEDAAAYRHSGLVAALLERHPRLHLLEVGP
jgi:hypothetical protein